MLALGSHALRPFVSLAKGGVVLVAVTAVTVALENAASADEPPTKPRDAELPLPLPKLDTAHGRIDGDLAVQAALGATFGPRSPRATADLRFRYLQTAGIFGTYEEGAVFGGGAEPRRVLATGIELRPLFLARWFQGMESGKPYVDLTIDSFALELGAAFVQPEGRPFGSSPGLQAGIGFAVPVFPDASGPLVAVHAGGRWSDAALGGAVDGPSDRAFYLSVEVGWQQIFGAHVVDMGDRAPR
jgi:hypothetical protein